MRWIVGAGLVPLCLSFLAISLSAVEAPPDNESAHWIWGGPDEHPAAGVHLERRFDIDHRVLSARFDAFLDHCDAEIEVNGKLEYRSPAYGPPVRLDLTEALTVGRNRIVLRCSATDGPSAVLARLVIETEDESVTEIVSDERWFVGYYDSPHTSTDDAQRDDRIWQIDFGVASSSEMQALRHDFGIRPAEDYAQWKRAIGTDAGTPPATFDVPAGFEVTLLRSAREDEDSWVSMTQDPQGRWIIAREKQGLLRITFNATSNASPEDQYQHAATVETINQDLAECRGLLFVGEDLYAMANNDKSLFRLRDSNGDDQFDVVERLSGFDGDVGHGRNQILLGPDGLLYGVFGDAVFEPQDAPTIVPPISHPDSVETTRSGFIARADPNTLDWEIVVRGLRNPYGMAFNQQGDMFTYDADAEYDMGSSWYRPTRMLHLLDGADYGWRRVTRRWPPYFPDRPDIPRPTLDIGKGSPTSVVFGTGERFPGRLGKALFVLDWAYGRIIAVHLEPYGASYRAFPETFLQGRPLNVTDVEFDSHGDMFFITGGRGTQSGLYRVRYVGNEATEEPPSEQSHRRQAFAERSRATLDALQQLYARPHSPLPDQFVVLLGNRDPWIRHAARTALEWQSRETLIDWVAAADEPHAQLAALIALIRLGDPADLQRIVDHLQMFDAAKLTDEQLHEFLFLVDRSLTSSNAIDQASRNRLVETVSDVYPRPTATVLNRLLADFLSRHSPAESFVTKTMDMLLSATDQADRLHYLFVLRNRHDGWNDELRQAYFEQLKSTDDFVRGEGMPTFLRLIREESLSTLLSDDRLNFEDYLDQSQELDWTQRFGGKSRDFVRQWDVSDFDELADELTTDRDLVRGAVLFDEARCAVCHQFGPRGGVSGPDLSHVGGRFAPADVMRSILEPSDFVSDKYRSDTFQLVDGQVVTGRIVPGDYRAETIRVATDLLRPSETIEFPKNEIEIHLRSPISPMPTGLLDQFTRDEILDLLAFMLTGESEQ